MTTFGWTESDIARLKELWDQGYSAGTIAKDLGTTRNSVIGKIHRNGWQRGLVKIDVRPAAQLPPRSHSSAGQAGGLAVKIKTIRERGPVKEKTFVSEECGKVALLDLEFGMCRFPIGDTRDENFGFCGDQQDTGSSYCRRHRSIAYESVEARRRRAAQFVNKEKLRKKVGVYA